MPKDTLSAPARSFENTRDLQFGSPRVSRTGAEPTQRSFAGGSGGPLVLIDWLAVTIGTGESVDELLPGAGELDWVELPRGRNGYRQARISGHITVLSDGTAEMGQHVIMSGSGCRQVEALELLGRGGWAGLLSRVVERGWSVARLDVAIDDRVGVLDLDTMIGALDAGHVTTRWHEWEISRTGGRSVDRPGRIIRFGSPTSDARLRVYDKAAEQISKGHAVEGTWIRVELQLRDSRARALVCRLAEDPTGRVAIGAVMHYIQFREPGGDDSNRSRWVVASWWVRFVDGVQRVVLGTSPAVRTVEEVRSWLWRQVAPAIALIVAADGGSVDDLYAMAREGRYRWRPQHRAMLVAAGV